MANELAFHGNDGYPLAFMVAIANPGASATTAATAAQGGPGLVVPTGYAFHPLLISAASNADLTAGTLTAKVTDNGTVLANGPTAVLSDLVQYAAGVQRAQAEPIAAGRRVGASVVTDAGYLPVTADIDILVSGVLLPA
jgi:hypothetical protein